MPDPAKRTDTMENPVNIRMMGLFTIEADGEVHEELMTKSRKGISLIQYLILERGRPVSSQRLIRELWADKRSENPEGALKTMVSRVRSALNEISPDLGMCIVSGQGNYRWQSLPHVHVDVLEIIDLLNSLRHEPPDPGHMKKTERLMELFQGDLYLTGDILNGQATFNWLHNEYLSAVYRYIELLKIHDEYTKICDVCRRASRIDDLDEQLHIELMQAMVNLNRSDEAAAEYRRLAKQSREYLDAEPGEELQACYDSLAEAGKTIRINLDTIRNELIEKEGGTKGPFFCSYEVFKEVYNIYRRTKDEMPADMLEIEEAEEEGVIFKNLTNPKEILKDENGHVKQVVLQCMELGEPDESGRRRPVPVEGKTETIDIDTVILAIGQAVDASIFDVDKTKKNAIAYDPDTYMTSMPGVFAGGDCGNDKISIAIEAIADAKKASEVIDSYLNGETIKYEKPFFVERDDITEKTFEDRERICREKADQLSAAERKDNFSEVVFGGLTEEQAVKEANRCLECGCHDYYECKLIELSNQYGVKSDRFCGEKNLTEFEDDHPFIARDPDKCILCGLCVRVCDEVMGVGALGLVNRGFDTVVMPNMMKPLAESGCESCGQCVACCPTGALQEKQTVQKEVPLDTEITETTCSYCSVGCSLDLESYGDMLIKANPDKEGYVNAGICCAKGKWGFDASVLEDKIVDPRIKDGDGFRLTDYHEAFVMMAKKLEAVRVRHGAESIGVAISDRYTNEEAYAIKKFADVIGARTFTFNRRASGVSEVLGLDHEASPNTIDELLSTDVILVPGFIKNRNAVIWNKIKQAAERGASVIVLNTEGAQDEWEFAAKVIDIDNST